MPVTTRSTTRAQQAQQVEGSAHAPRSSSNGSSNGQQQEDGMEQEESTEDSTEVESSQQEASMQESGEEEQGDRRMSTARALNVKEYVYSLPDYVLLCDLSDEEAAFLGVSQMVVNAGTFAIPRQRTNALFGHDGPLEWVFHPSSKLNASIWGQHPPENTNDAFETLATLLSQLIHPSFVDKVYDADQELENADYLNLLTYQLVPDDDDWSGPDTTCVPLCHSSDQARRLAVKGIRWELKPSKSPWEENSSQSYLRFYLGQGRISLDDPNSPLTPKYIRAHELIAYMYRDKPTRATQRQRVAHHRCNHAWCIGWRCIRWVTQKHNVHNTHLHPSDPSSSDRSTE